MSTTSTNYTEQDPILAIKKKRDDALATIEAQREEVMRQYAVDIRSAVDSDPDESMTSAARKLGVERNGLYQLFRRYIPTA